MIQHAGNAANQMQFEEHDGANNAKRVTLALAGAGLTSLPTLYAVVNTSSAGAVTVTPVGLSTLAPSPNFIGLATVVPGANVTLNASSAFIGITTIANQPALVASSAYIGLITVGGIGTVTLSDPKGYIGLVTVGGIGTLTLADSKGFIGLTTVVPGSNVTLNASSAFIGITTIANQLPLVAGTAYIGLVTVGGIGTLTLADPKGFIGLTTLGGGFTAISDGADTVMKLSIASVADGKYLMAGIRSNSTVLLGNQPPLTAGAAYIGLVTIGGIGTLTLADPKGFIGLTTVVPGSNVTLNASSAFIGIVTLANQPALVASGVYIGLVTVGGIGTLTLADPKGYIGLTTSTLGVGTQFIGLATVVTSGNITVLTRNSGTNKTLKILPVTLSTGSVATIVVPSNTFYITHVLLNSNATVRLNIKSGVTYLTGNASLGVNIFPGGGWVETGTPDSPTYIGQAAAAAIVVEKADAGGLISQIGGKIVYFDE